jgi:hypothetical protein
MCSAPVDPALSSDLYARDLVTTLPLYNSIQGIAGGDSTTGLQDLGALMQAGTGHCRNKGRRHIRRALAYQEGEQWVASVAGKLPI